MVLFGIAVNSSSNSGYPGLTIFEEEGKCTGARQIQIMQNATHIRAIRKYIDDTIPIYSVIAFSDNCTLKDITVKSNVIVTYYSDLLREIKYKLSEINNYSMTPELLNETYNKLSQYANADEYTKFQHINNNR